jgi:hypothetical protein
MKSVFYIVAIILILIWAVGLFILTIGEIVHVLLIVAATFFLIGIIRDDKRIKK